MDEQVVELVILWVLTGSAVAIMILRILLKQYRRQDMLLGECFTLAAIVSILLRGAVIHIALVWGTNNITNATRKTIVFTPKVIYQHEVGSKLTIVNRVFYTIYTWLQKCVVMCVLQRVLKGLRAEKIVPVYWGALGITFVIAFVVTFTDCHPFKLYYQVIPNPGICSKGIIQLEVFSALNMTTDLMLIILPLPTLMKVRRPIKERIRLASLFLVGLTIVAVTLIRLLMNVVFLHRSGQSHNVANVEIFFAAFVANAPTIYGLLNMERRARKDSRRPYSPDSYILSQSEGKITSNISTSRDMDASREESSTNLPSDIWLGKTRYINDSDEYITIELESARHPDIRIKV